MNLEPRDLSKSKEASERSDKDLELWHNWNNNKNPETLNILLKQINPMIKSEVTNWERSGIDPIILKVEGHNLALNALNSYNPEKSQLNTHVINNMRHMSRFVNNHQNAVRVTEEKIYGYRKFNNVKEQLEMELGRLPTQEEIEMQMGNAGKVSDFIPMQENLYSTSSETGTLPQNHDLNSNPIALQLLRDDLSDDKRFILDATYGLNGQKILMNKDIAKILNKSAPMITKHKNAIDIKMKRYLDGMNSIM